jgi:SAM dependent carboxyl methyltransferase
MVIWGRSRVVGSLMLKLSAMEGGGYYNQNSAMQAAGIELLLPIWKRVAQTVAIGEGPLVIVDYGSSQGRNSMRPMRVAIEELRARNGSGVAIAVVHTDLPSNDFTALFTALAGPDSYMNGTPGIYPSAIGRSYFEPIIAPTSVHLGWNSWTMQWLSANAPDAPDHVFAALSTSPQVQKALAVQQALDWKRFLEVRSSELRQGAKLLSAFSGKAAEATGWEWLGGELWAAILDLRRDGILSETEALRITLPTASRSLDAIRAPFASKGQYAGLEIEHAEILKVPDPYWSGFQKTGDRQAFAECHANMVRAWAGPTIASVLKANRDPSAALNALFVRFAERVAAAPRQHEPLLAVTVLKKR